MICQRFREKVLISGNYNSAIKTCFKQEYEIQVLSSGVNIYVQSLIAMV